MAYILDVNNADVRTEGMSYGMMICLQLDKKKEFDALWKWAKTYMQYPDTDERRGYFSWQCATDGSKKGGTPASDGEEYFVMALMFASERWGDGQGIFNYSNEANYILEMSAAKPDKDINPYSSYTPLFDPTEMQVVFVPYASAAKFTDPPTMCRPSTSCGPRTHAPTAISIPVWQPKAARCSPNSPILSQA